MRTNNAFVRGCTIAALMIGSTFVTSASAEPHRDAAQLARGRYLVKTSGCNDCHTSGYLIKAGQIDEAQWLTGSNVGYLGPWGTTYPANLRLLVQKVTREQWLLLARQQARPPMPWFALREMTDEDLTAIYEFVRSLGPAGAEAPPYVPPGEAVSTPVLSLIPADSRSIKAPVRRHDE